MIYLAIAGVTAVIALIALVFLVFVLGSRAAALSHTGLDGEHASENGEPSSHRT